MERIIESIRVETEPVPDFDDMGISKLKPGPHTLTLKNKYGDILFHGTDWNMDKLLSRLPHSLREEIRDRGIDLPEGEKETPVQRLCFAAKEFEQALAAFNPAMIDVKVRNSTDYIEFTSLEEPRKTPGITVQVRLKTDEQVYP